MYAGACAFFGQTGSRSQHCCQTAWI